MQDEHGGAGRGRGEPGHPAPASRSPPALQTLRLRSDKARHSSDLLSNITSISSFTQKCSAKLPGLAVVTCTATLTADKQIFAFLTLQNRVQTSVMTLSTGH